MRTVKTLLAAVALLVLVANLALTVYVFGVARDLAGWAEMIGTEMQIEELQSELPYPVD